MATRGERKTPGLPSVYQARSDRERGRYSRGSPALWISAALGLVSILVAYHFVSEKQLAGAKDALLAKERAVSATIGTTWFPLRDAIEKATVDAAIHVQADYIDPEATHWDFRALPGLYLRLRTADAKDVTTLRHATASSKRDGFISCFLHEPNAAAARGDADAGAFAEQPWNWQNAYAATRILTPEWVQEVNTSDDALRLRVFEQQYDKAMKEEIPGAIDLVKRAQFFLLILDEDSAAAQPDKPGAPLTETDLQRVPHFARVHLIDLRNKKEILRLRRSAEAGFIFTGEHATTDPEMLDAMKRQVNNCALAKEVDRTLKEASAPSHAPAQ